VVVYDGIDPAVEGGHEQDRARVCREFGIPGDSPIVGMMARVAPQKDFPTLARAAVQILKFEPRTRFLIVGDYTSAQTYRDHYRDLRRILEDCGVSRSFIFTGHREDVPRLFGALDIFVLSTHWEGLPLVILEAMAHGKPVVATAVDGIPEVIEDGENGLLFPHEDAERLAAQVTGLLRDHGWSRKIGESGRALVHTRFSTRQFADSMTAVYHDVLARGRLARGAPSAAADALEGG
jgi:glycosyltransferase involved in cell wall biosynthesis